MFQVNPQMLIQMIRQGKNPQQLMMSVLQGQANTPLTQNLLSLVQQGRGDEIVQVVKNIYAQSGGRNFDQDFEAFRRDYGF